MAKDSKTNKKKMSGTTITIIVSAIVLFALAIGLVGANAVATSGIIDRHTAVVSTENYSISGSMMTYIFNSTYLNIANSYSGLIDSTKSLKEQEISNGMSWYDYILNSARNDAANYLLMAQGAKEAGITLDEHDMEEIDEIMEQYKSAAKSSSYSLNNYLRLTFGSGVKANDMKECLKLAQLSSKYQEAMTDGYKAVYTNDDFTKYFDENKNNYMYVDYYSYTFNAEKGEGDAVTDETKAAAKALAEELKAAATNSDSFKAYVETYLTEKAESELEEGETLDKSEIVSSVEGTLSAHAGYSTLNTASSDIAKWAYEEAVPGAVKELYNEETGAYTIYMLDKAPYRDEYITRNGALIFLSNSKYTDEAGASAKADEIIAEWNNSGKTENDFLELVEKYSESGHAHIEENLKKNLSYSNWLYSSDRKTGDVDKVVSSSDKGVYIVYYAGESGFEAWQADVRDALANAEFQEKWSELSATYYVTVNDKKVSKISPVTRSR